MVAPRQLQLAPARFAGRQQCNGIVPDFDLWTLTAAIPGHPEGSTVSSETLERLGYAVPRASSCLGQSSATATAPRPDLPAPLPNAADCPPQRCFLEVVPHPAGGYTLAEPVDATRSSVRLYRGQWSTAEAAQAALDAKF